MAAGLIDTSELIPHERAQGIPDDYQTEHATPDAFGAAIGQGLEKAGNEAASTAGFYGKVSADYAYNNVADGTNKILYGDPTQKGQDGTPDHGFFSLQGQAASDAWPQVKQKLSDLVAAQRKSLSSPDSLLDFDTNSRRLLSYTNNSIGQHANQQYNAFASATNAATGNITLNAIGSNPNDQGWVDLNTNKMVDAAQKEAHLKGATGPDDPISVNLVQKARQDALKAQVLAMSTTPEGASRAQTLLESKKDVAGDLYPVLEQHVKTQASQHLVDTGTAAAVDQASREHQGGGSAFASGSGQDQAAGALRHYEGLRTQPYWDVNHWRTGYGSDTITKADGTVQPVNQNTKITPDDAERDLNRRVVETQTKIQTQVSPQAWTGLNKTQQAAVTSMGYNYGMLPQDVAFAIRGGGGPAAISAAILNHQNDNGGVNRQRRIDEAKAVNGGSMPSGLPVTAPSLEGPQGPIGEVSPAFQAAMGASPAPVQPSIQTAPDTPSVPTSGTSALQPAAYLAHETSPAGYSPMLGAMNATSVAARAMQIWGERTDITPEQREAGFTKLRQNLTQAQFAADATQQAIKQQSNDQAKSYVPRLIGGDATAIADIARDPKLEFSTQKELLSMARENGLQGAAGMGPSYNDALKRLVLPNGDPNRISNYTQLLQMRNNGELSDQGLSKVGADMEKVKQQDFQGVVTAKAAVLDQVKNYMTYGEEGNSPGALKDPKGKEANDKFVVAFEADFDARIAKGENPFDILKDQKGIKALSDSIRSPEQKRIDQIQESVGNEAQAYNPAAEQAAPPPAPEKVSPDTWNQVIEARPTMQTNSGPQKLRRDAWGSFLTTLLSKPADVQQTVLKSFAQRFPGSDIEGPFARLLSESQAPGGPPSRPVTPTPASVPDRGEQTFLGP